jgi:ribosomal-protein-alanine N-acetyltransferase
MPEAGPITRSPSYTVRWSGGSARLRSWRNSADIAQLTLSSERAPTEAAVAEWQTWLRMKGFQRIVTNALTTADALPLIDIGYVVRERLHLLAHDLRAIPNVHHRSRRAFRFDWPAVLTLDNVCFDDFWRLDEASLRDALGATPSRRFRLVHRDGLAAYAITGRSDKQGFVQRLAVDPLYRRTGLGTGLIVDALEWLRGSGARQALVNTQITNEDALALYRNCGFTQLPVGLCILEYAL